MHAFADAPKRLTEPHQRSITSLARGSPGAQHVGRASDQAAYGTCASPSVPAISSRTVAAALSSIFRRSRV